MSGVSSELHQGVLNAPQSLTDYLPYGTARCVSLADALHLVELLKKILLVLWEWVFGLIRGWLLDSLLGGFGGVSVLVEVVVIGVLLVVGVSYILRGFVFDGLAWRGFPRLVVSCGLGLVLGPSGWVGRCWNLAFAVGGARVS